MDFDELEKELQWLQWAQVSSETKETDFCEKNIFPTVKCGGWIRHFVPPQEKQTKGFAMALTVFWPKHY